MDIAFRKCRLALLTSPTSLTAWLCAPILVGQTGRASLTCSPFWLHAGSIFPAPGQPGAASFSRTTHPVAEDAACRWCWSAVKINPALRQRRLRRMLYVVDDLLIGDRLAADIFQRRDILPPVLQDGIAPVVNEFEKFHRRLFVACLADGKTGLAADDRHHGFPRGIPWRDERARFKMIAVH